jgi:hypothetical protein
MAASRWRIAGIMSSVNSRGRCSASTVRAAASSGSKGGGTAGTAKPSGDVPGPDVVVIIASLACDHCPVIAFTIVAPH